MTPCLGRIAVSVAVAGTPLPSSHHHHHHHHCAHCLWCTSVLFRPRRLSRSASAASRACGCTQGRAPREGAWYEGDGDERWEIGMVGR